jgi:hypothetical protein
VRTLERNKQTIKYKLYVDKEELLDEYGNRTGEFKILYSDPATLRANVSAARGESLTRQFGDMESYDKVIITDEMDCPINETSVLWIDDLDTEKPYDYVVKKVARSLNSVSYAVSKVNVSA